MGVYELLTQRKTVRNFDARPIPEDVVARFVEVANRAPTGGNIQPWSFILVRDAQARADLAAIVGGQPWVKAAPLAIIFCLDFLRLKRWAGLSNATFRGEQSLCHFLIGYADIMCAAQNMVLLAEELGLGSVYIGTVQATADEVRARFDIPRYVVPAMLLSLGYPKRAPVGAPKLAAGAVVHEEKYRPLSDTELVRAYDEKYPSVDENVTNFLERAYVEAVEMDAQGDGGRQERVRAEMQRLGVKTNAQFLFGVRYPADMMVAMNADLLATFSNAGYDCFRAHAPGKPEGSGD